VEPELTRSSNPQRAAVRLYIAAVTASAALLSGYFVLSPEIGWSNQEPYVLEIVAAGILSVAIALLSEMRPILIPSTQMFEDGGDEWTASSVVYVAGLLLFGPLFAILIVGIAMPLSNLLLRKSLSKVFFNTGQYVLTIGISALILTYGTGGDRSAQHLLGSMEALPAVLIALLAFFMLNTALVAGVVAIADRVQFLSVWITLVRHGQVQYGTTLVIGMIATILWTFNPLTIALLVLPMAMVYIAWKAIIQLKSETSQALVAIAEMVDARDAYAYRHSQKVAHYATLLAIEMGLPIEDVEAIKMAAQLHDIGKIGTPDRVLHKSGPLSLEERQVMREHPRAGANVLRYFSLFKDGADLALYHHEHYDGSGYPKGLAGEEIPIGSRIIHVVDAYDAMTSDRVYRKALSPEIAMSRLLEGAGRQFDPEVVKAFVEVLRQTGTAPSELPHLAKRASTLEGEAEPSLVAGRG
jgi:putative nucleotidyltransferase with HDIG domain